jgi:hypothetical protein
MLRAIMALDSSYLRESEFGPFFIEASYDRSSTFKREIMTGQNI